MSLVGIQEVQRQKTDLEDTGKIQTSRPPTHKGAQRVLEKLSRIFSKRKVDSAPSKSKNEDHHDVLRILAGNDGIPSVTIPDYRRNIAIPIDNQSTTEVSTTPLFVDALPKVDYINDVQIGINTRNKAVETVISGRNYFLDPLSPGESVIARVSAKGEFPHARSFNWMENGNLEPEIIKIQGKEYSGISTKGGDLHYPYIRKDEHFANGIRVNGAILESTALALVKNSNWLLAHHITSEVVWSVSRIDQLPWTNEDKLEREDNLLTPWVFIEKLLERAKQRNEKLPENDRVDLTAAKKALQPENFVIINRATTVPFRLSDLEVPFQQGGSQEEFNFMMNYMFSYLNRSRSADEQLQFLQIPTGSEKERQAIQERNQTECAKFFAYFAQNLGTQIGRLHKNDVVHGFLHKGNLTPDGTFVDIDSLSGEPINKTPITDTDIVDDITLVVLETLSTMEILSRQGLLLSSMPAQITQDFLYQYAQTRWPGEENVDNQTRGMEDILEKVIDDPDDIPKLQKRTPGGILMHVLTLAKYRRTIQWLRKNIQEPTMQKIKGNHAEKVI